MVFLIVWCINKMVTHGTGGLVDGSMADTATIPSTVFFAG